MKTFIVFLTTLFVVGLNAETEPKKPNFVVIFTDDQGYGDLGCFGGDHVKTPRIDQMAKEGARLTSFYVAAPVCTPSRAALMTGCYPKRVNMETGSNFGVLLANDTKGLHPDEITIADVLKKAGYKTGMFGKWHLGDHPDFMPLKQGFDTFWGIPYSHDIHPFHPRQNHFKFPALPLLDGETVIEMDPDADYLTKRITEQAVAFIKTHQEDPFFVYIPHPLPHVPLHVAPKFMEEASPEIKKGLAKETKEIDYYFREKLFKQSIAEIDWSVGQILDTLKECGLDDNTLVIFTSDNGAGRYKTKDPRPNHSGPLSGAKGSTLEGGMREPTVIRWPGKIQAGKDNGELMTTMDLLPTFAKLAGIDAPTDRIIDGKDITDVLLEHKPTPHEAFFYHRGAQLNAVRSGEWKLHLSVPAKKGKRQSLKLHNLTKDIAEKINLAREHPEEVKRLQKLADVFQKELNENRRPAGFVKTPHQYSLNNE